jgi:hypothetical protein
MRKLAIALALVPAAAQAQTTPETLQQLIECRSTPDALMAFGMELFSDKPPAWMTPVKDDSHAGMLGLATYRLTRPVVVFGRTVDRVSLINQWVVIELPRADALATIAGQRMERAPIHATEQYYRFVDDQAGPMLGAFAPTDDALETALAGTPPKPDSANKTLFVGCNYAAMSKAQFLDAAHQADAMMGQMGSALQKMLLGGAKP